MTRISPGFRYMAAGALAFSVMSALVKLAGARLPTQQIVFARALVTVVLSAWVVGRRRVPPLGNERGLLFLRGALGFLALSCFYFGVIHLPLADATVIQFTSPVFTALIAAVALAEVLRWREVSLALVSLTGVVIVARPEVFFGGGGRLDPFAVTVALAGALLSASAYVTVRKLSRTEDPYVIVLHFGVISTLGSLPFALRAWVAPTPTEWLVLLGVGVSTQLGQIFITHGLGRERAGRAMSVGYLQIVFAAVWGALLFAEIPDRWTVTGALVIVGSTLLLAQEPPRRVLIPPSGGGDDADVG